jgi:2-amino-4-hydroxy-6-hydroxymethyldihydropteridine diphosphokinase
MPRIYISIGSNIDRERNIRSCVVALRQRFGALTASRVYLTPAVGFEGEDFYNLVAGFDSDEPVQAVITTLREIEAAHGRTRSDARFGPRTLDLDLLLYGDALVDIPGLRLPRAEITQYNFVLMPLVEIAPGLIHPGTGERFADLWAAYQGDKALIPVDLS